MNRGLRDCARWLRVALIAGLGLVLFSPRDGAGAAQLGLGAKCKSNADCKSGACDSGTGRKPRCVPKKGAGNVGDFCQAVEQCKGTCEDGKCAPPQPNGKGCLANHECISKRCGTWAPGTRACIPNDGTAKVGELCSHPNHCQNKNCVNYKCTAKAPVGAACSNNAGCGSGRCDNNEQKCIPADGTGNNGSYCTHNNHCKSKSCIAFKCASQPKNVVLGGACAANSNCKSGRCDFASGAGGQKCIPNDNTGHVGDYCSHNHQCKSKSCTQNKCKAPSKEKLGASCGANSDCLSGVCDTTYGSSRRTCIPANGTGKNKDYCTSAEQCQSGSCVKVVPSCVLKAGAPCATHCGPKLKVGQGCLWNTECASGVCSTWSPGTKACVPKDGTANVGDLCSHNNHCKNKNCQNHKCTAGAALGQSCSSGPSCRSGRCDGAKRKCIPNDGHGNVDDYCTHNNQCKNKNCSGYKCRAPKGLGEYCSSNGGCKSGRCDAAPGNPRKCIPNDGTGKSGDYCTHNNQCKPGYACALKPGKKYGNCKH